METYKAVTGVKSLNRHIELGWKRIHVFSKLEIVESVTDKEFADYKPAFVIVWDFPGNPVEPKRTEQADVQPIPSVHASDSDS